jgi:hypothetical protein
MSTNRSEGSDQQWLLRGNSSPSFEIGGRLCGGGRRDDRESLTFSGSDAATRSERSSLAMSPCSIAAVQHFRGGEVPSGCGNWRLALAHQVLPTVFSLPSYS